MNKAHRLPGWSRSLSFFLLLGMLVVLVGARGGCLPEYEIGLVTWNLQNERSSGDGSDYRARIEAGIESIIAAKSPDIIALQEVMGTRDCCFGANWWNVVDPDEQISFILDKLAQHIPQTTARYELAWLIRTHSSADWSEYKRWGMALIYNANSLELDENGSICYRNDEHAGSIPQAQADGARFCFRVGGQGSRNSVMGGSRFEFEPTRLNNVYVNIFNVHFRAQDRKFDDADDVIDVVEEVMDEACSMTGSYTMPPIVLGDFNLHPGDLVQANSGWSWLFLDEPESELSTGSGGQAITFPDIPGASTEYDQIKIGNGRGCANSAGYFQVLEYWSQRNHRDFRPASVDGGLFSDHPIVYKKLRAVVLNAGN